MMNRAHRRTDTRGGRPRNAAEALRCGRQDGCQRDSARWSCAFVIFERPLTLRRFASS
jgi:hypothetical protein